MSTSLAPVDALDMVRNGFENFSIPSAVEEYDLRTADLLHLQDTELHQVQRHSRLRTLFFLFDERRRRWYLPAPNFYGTGPEDLLSLPTIIVWRLSAELHSFPPALH